MKTYDVNVERDGKFWLITIPELDGATQGRTLQEVPEMAKDYISLVTEEPEDSFELNVTVTLPPAARQHWEKALILRRRELESRAESAAESRAAARALKEQGLTLRDIGAALDVSYQRAHQLVAPK